MPTKRKAIGIKTASDKAPAIPSIAGYDDFLQGLKERIRAAQVRAALAVNQGVGSALLANGTRHS